MTRVVQMNIAWHEPFWGGLCVILGLLVGSFLNVVIYRVPRGLRVNQPKRSFCPTCETLIPWYRNVPVFTWLIQLGKCRACGGRIAARYVIVEALTGVLFGISWGLSLGWGEWFLVAFFLSLLIAISFIDAEHLIIPSTFTYVGAVVGILGACFFPGWLNLLFGEDVVGKSAILKAAIGGATGYCGLMAVVYFGKIAFGKRRMTFKTSKKWSLKEPTGETEDLKLVIGEEEIQWGEMFYRRGDQLVISGENFVLDGESITGSEMIIISDQVQIEGKSYAISQLKSLEGDATRLVIPREAMGSGDPLLLGMIGVFIGWQGVLFTIMSSCFYALGGVLMGRFGFGKPLPYGPFLALGAVTWLFGGWKIWQWYLQFLNA